MQQKAYVRDRSFGGVLLESAMLIALISLVSIASIDQSGTGVVTAICDAAISSQSKQPGRLGKGHKEKYESCISAASYKTGANKRNRSNIGFP